MGLRQAAKEPLIWIQGLVSQAEIYFGVYSAKAHSLQLQVLSSTDSAGIVFAGF